MALITEDGSGKADAESYASVAAADAYVAARGLSGWDGLAQQQKESALILGCDYLEVTYGQSWQGCRTSPEQTLSWPRAGVVVDGRTVPSDSIPVAVIKANIEMALRAGAGEPLIADQGRQVVKEKVDVLEVTYREYSDPATRYPYVNRLLMAYLKSGTSDGASFQQVRLVRA